ncbi:hypothetical protein CHARACLAT_004796 [Characodon lateralis]|uniref:Uncharacterized protein n=1 Tax=Characodon lateralis TaxID=208331 RepID=A0ABU7DXS5_9TELE|nr:hypothetical protein [Characodon lateralis]
MFGRMSGEHHKGKGMPLRNLIVGKKLRSGAGAGSNIISLLLQMSLLGFLLLGCHFPHVEWKIFLFASTSEDRRTADRASREISLATPVSTPDLSGRAGVWL